MIRHIIRQERHGGYWFLRDQGRAVELSPLGYHYLATLRQAGWPNAWQDDDLEAALNREGSTQIVQLVKEQALYSDQTWRSVHWVPSDVRPEALPVDAVAAPKRIYFEITRRCNLACRSCFNESRLSLPNELTLEEVLEINRQAQALGVFEIRYTGGECTTVPWFREVIEDAKQRGFYISIGTNGVYSDAMLEWLPDSNIDWFIISLDGDRETNDWVRGRGTFDRVLKTLRVLARRPAIRVRLNMVVARHNVSSIEAVSRIAVEHGVESLNLIPLRPYGRSVRRMVHDMFTQRDFYAFIENVNRLRRAFPQVRFSTTIDLLDPDASTSHDFIVQKKTTCAAGVEACVVGPMGDVYGCSYSPASFPDANDVEGRAIFVAGNVRRESLRTIWRDSQRWAVFRDLERYKHPKCFSCQHYTVRCSGSCAIMAWYELNKDKAVESARESHIGKVCDPYCFADLLQAEAGEAYDVQPVLSEER